ncbi:MAG: tetratricopeptide repeat protein, partial [Gemmatimonadales bacterium]
LGVVAYNLLTGAVRFSAGSSTAQHRERVAAEPPRPLAAAASAPAAGWSAGRRRRWLRGDVERVIQMALRKDPARRYASADEFGGDLERLLQGRPVVARPDGAWYRFRRLVGRNRVASVLVAGLAFGLTLTGAAAVDRAVRAERARAAAAEAAARSRRVTGFLAELLGAPDPWRGDRDVTVRQLLRQAAARAAADFGDDPGVEAAVRLALGRSFRGLGQVTEAREQLARALELARTAGLGDERFAAERGLAEVTADEGDLALARVWYDSAGSDARGRGDSLGVATVAADLAWLFGLLGYPDSAGHMADRAVELRRRYRAEPVELANALNNQAVTRLEAGDVAGGRAAVDEAVAALRAAGRGGRPALAAALATRAGVLADQGDLAGADSGYRESLALRRAIFGPGHPDEIGTLVNLGVTALGAGRPQEAVAWADSVLSRIGPDGVPADHPLVAAVRTVRGGAWNALGRFAEARDDLEAALTIRRAGLPPGHPALAYTLTALGNTYVGLGRPAAARAVVAEAGDILEAAFGSDHPRTRSAREQLSRIGPAASK